MIHKQHISQSGLIIEPANLAARIKCLVVHSELVLVALDRLKPLFLSQNKASRKLSQETMSESNNDAGNENQSTGRSSESVRVLQPKPDTDLRKLEKSNKT